MPTLHILQGPDKGHTFDITHTPSLVGRDSPDLPLTDNTISRRHAQLIKKNNTWVIKDLNSANGTYVNGVKISGSHELISSTEGQSSACVSGYGLYPYTCRQVQLLQSDQEKALLH